MVEKCTGFLPRYEGTIVDGGNTIGYIAAFRGAEIAARKAKETGLSIVGVYNSFYSGRNAWYVENIVRHELVAIHTCSASPRVLPPGSRTPLLGTNPISIGFPSTNGPVVWDIGTASVMWGDVQLMARLARTTGRHGFRQGRESDPGRVRSVARRRRPLGRA